MVARIVAENLNQLSLLIELYVQNMFKLAELPSNQLITIIYVTSNELICLKNFGSKICYFLNNETLKNGNVRVCSSDNKLALGPNITDPKKTVFLQISHVYKSDKYC